MRYVNLMNETNENFSATLRCESGYKINPVIIPKFYIGNIPLKYNRLPPPVKRFVLNLKKFYETSVMF